MIARDLEESQEKYISVAFNSGKAKQIESGRK